jgi:hypothetical protein
MGLNCREPYEAYHSFSLAFSPAPDPVPAAPAPGSSLPPESVNRPGIAVLLVPVPLAAGAALGRGSRTGGPGVARLPSRARPPKGPLQPRSIHRCRGGGGNRNIPRIRNNWDSRTLRNRVGNRHILHNRSSRVERHTRSLHRSRHHRRDCIPGRLRHAIPRRALVRHNVERLIRLGWRSVEPPKKDAPVRRTARHKAPAFLRCWRGREEADWTGRNTGQLRFSPTAWASHNREIPSRKAGITIRFLTPHPTN